MTDFAQLLQNEIPRLRGYARTPARDAARADDLVQSCLVRAIAKGRLWEPGADLRAWLFTILHKPACERNPSFGARGGISVAFQAAAPVLTLAPRAAESLRPRDLEWKIQLLPEEHQLLPEEQMQVLLLVGLGGMRYGEVAAVLDIPIGTVRSRLSRGRAMLRRLMDLEEMETNSEYSKSP